MQTGLNHRRSFRSNDFRMPLIFQLTVFVFVLLFFFHGVNYMIQYDSTAYSRLHTSYFSSQSRAGVFVRVLNL